MKIMNPNYKDIDIEPINIWSRDIIGKSVDLNNVKNIDKDVSYLLENGKKYEKDINKMLKDSIYNLGASASVGAKYIIECIQNRIDERKKENEK